MSQTSPGGPPRALGRSGTRRASSQSVGAFALSMVGLTLVLRLAPVSSGSVSSRSTPSTLRSPPSFASSVATSSSASFTSCSFARVTIPPSFSTSTGVGRFAARDSDHACANPLGSGAKAQAQIVVSLKLPTHVGQSQVSLVAAANITGTHSVTAGKCVGNVSSNHSYCDVYSESYVTIAGYVEDLTNLTRIEARHQFDVINESEASMRCVGASNCTEDRFAVNGTFQINATGVLRVVTPGFVRGHVYALVVTFFACALVNVDTYFGATITGARATGSINAATGGSGLFLRQIIVS